jgi:hypothetical protein
MRAIAGGFYARETGEALTRPGHCTIVSAVTTTASRESLTKTSTLSILLSEHVLGPDGNP